MDKLKTIQLQQHSLAGIEFLIDNKDGLARLSIGVAPITQYTHVRNKK